jgi:hypothetical protein
MDIPSERLGGARGWVRRAALAGGCLVLTLTGCSGGASGADVAKARHTAFAAANFVEPTTSTNRWHPLRPGTQWVRQGTTTVGSRKVPHQVVSTMTDVVRVIDGVRTIAMLDQDTDAGQLAEASIDYLGLDKDGNVWLLGSYTADYSGGRYTNTADAWLGTARGGEVGILLPADPTRKTPRWFIGRPPRGAGSAGEVVETGKHQCVEFTCYDGVLVVREAEAGDTDDEFKSYAPDVGLILNSPRPDSKQKDVESLVNLRQLSATGLTEMSDEVLRLEAHARKAVPDLFGAPSTRAP